MSKFTDAETLRAALRDLGHELTGRGARYDLFIVGGSAWLLHEPNRARATGDVDIAAAVLDDGAIKRMVALPRDLQAAADAVATVHRLSAGWLNAAASASFPDLVPDGAIERAKVETWGGLTIRIAGRIDLLRLKFQAGLRRGSKGDRFRADLVSMHPTAADIDAILEWYLSTQSDREAAAERAAEVARDIKDRLHE